MHLKRRLAICSVLASCALEPKVELPSKVRIAVVGPLEKVSARNLGSFSRLAQDWVYEPLARFGDDGSLEPALAKTLERRGKELRFQLRKGVRFSDASEVTSEDVKRSLERSGVTFRLDGDSVVTASNAEYLIPFAPIWKKSGDTEIGTGPFKVTSERSDRIVLQRRLESPHKAATVELIGYDTPREALARTLKGDADVLPRVEPRLAEFFQNVTRIRLVRGNNTQVASVGFSLRLTAEQRRGLSASLPIKELGEAGFGDSCKPWAGPRSSPGTIPDRRLDIMVPVLDIGYQRMGLALRRAMGPLAGSLQTKSAADAIKTVVEGKIDVFVVPVLVWPPPAIGVAFHSGSANNIWGYSDAMVDHALDAGDWNGALKALADDPPALFVCLPERLLAIDSRVKNPRIGASASLEFLPEWEFGE